MNPDKILCPCKKVSKGDVVKAIQQGARSYKEMKAATGAGSKCGHCKAEVKAFIKAQVKKA